MDMDYSIEMGMQHGDGHVACIRHVCNNVHVHVPVHYLGTALIFKLFFQVTQFNFTFIHFVLLAIFASYHIRFASIRFLSYLIRITNFRIRFEANISESNPSIRYFA
jgi:hypothetical protein